MVEPLRISNVRLPGSYCYLWNTACCWIDSATVAIWGFGDDDEYIIPAILIFDALNGKLIRWFAGPEGRRFFYDELLFSTSRDSISVWDFATGERLLHEPNFSPFEYHQQTKQFISLDADGQITVSTLRR